jgi:hypothetical protein
MLPRLKLSSLVISLLWLKAGLPMSGLLNDDSSRSGDDKKDTISSSHSLLYPNSNGLPKRIVSLSRACSEKTRTRVGLLRSICSTSSKPLLVPDSLSRKRTGSEGTSRDSDLRLFLKTSLLPMLSSRPSWDTLLPSLGISRRTSRSSLGNLLLLPSKRLLANT